ncbi:cinnamoyl-CoA reductase 1-like [Pyrus ussuriensis x Pyrus communis]|uniref:Cinnamoyl-CoA reductase 1-like n=1 Tax=Pyrus ussuriensis x Pyrus communis TaxID=2448454 RepID=A0A5N5HVN6_9ROSA|nr:cinnamoyl-CoA reductase 1-like [Pyrus ussuriensis x Pyrus communis]
MEMMAAPAEEEKERVCVTGAGGFVGSWIVKLLLSSDYLVHGTVRKPPDLLDYNSLCSAVAGCSGVFHVASPVIPSASVTNPQVELIEPAVKGTLNVLSACLEAKVKRVVVVSSISALFVSLDWPKGQVKDETCWSVPEYMTATKKWYLLSKTLAEREALEFGKRTGLEIITVLPSLNLGPILQPTMNASSWFLAKVLKGNTYFNLFSTPYICLVFYGSLSHPEEEEKSVSSDRLQRLGWSYRPLKETLIDSIESYRKASIPPTSLQNSMVYASPPHLKLGFFCF